MQWHSYNKDTTNSLKWKLQKINKELQKVILDLFDLVFVVEVKQILNALSHYDMTSNVPG